ncbi:MAG: methyltransferase domain-containing protein [Deltaproteobacteria bacterium]|jgi:2-polyprenyl-3-methyl-5-hydroxy-6-metoxy-1,4-benzoquinol methylase|nr:methyltransferase domain-containing protein [Deltaproteobacteria bacterium]
MTAAPYFVNHARKDRFPWSVYHRPLIDGFAQALAPHRGGRVLVVGCGLEPFFPGVNGVTFFGCDLDPQAIDESKKLFPEMKDRLAVCPSENELPSEGPFAGDFDVVLAKEVVEHLPTPEPWARMLAARVKVGGSLLLSTPNYGLDSSLGILERTVLEWFARKDGYTRAHIHPSKFDRKRLRTLDVGPGMELVDIDIPWTRWTLLGHWRRSRSL